MTGVRTGKSSPRPWRCFRSLQDAMIFAAVFSTSVEVFLCIFRPISSLSRLLHVRGGVSAQQLSTSAWGKSSPRPWRCFHVHSLVYIAKFVFSTSVEVFLTLTKQLSVNIQSSPRPWRCFSLSVSLSSVFCVFSTSVEVFLNDSVTITIQDSLLHVRGGVSA